VTFAPIVALAGRRIDPPNPATQRFPLGNAPLVRERLRTLFVACRADTLVCSAACGADLLALEVAASLGLRRRVVLPFDPGRFRETSVVDRPGDWGTLFDRLIDTVARDGDLVVLPDESDGDAAYAAANQAILDEGGWLAQARELAADLHGTAGEMEPLLAVVVWDGRSRGNGDLSARFGALARTRGVPVVEVLTMDQTEGAGAGA